MSDVLLVEIHRHIALLTLNRPEVHNALSEKLIDALHEAIKKLGALDEVHVIVITGAGKSFCSGHDLKELTDLRGRGDGGRRHFVGLMEACSDMMQEITLCPKPIIAAVNGMATAAGCQLVASCDLAVASENACFATPGVNIGLFCHTPAVALSRTVARKYAMEMLLLGDSINSRRAQEIGLINKVAEGGSALDLAMSWASFIAGKAPLTVQGGKQAFYRQLEVPLEDAYAQANAKMVYGLLNNESEVGIAAFLQKK